MRHENLKVPMSRKTYRKHKKHFEKEDRRKDLLFASINLMIKENFHRFGLEVDEWEDRFEDIYNGFATVIEKQDDSISLKLDNNVIIEDIKLLGTLIKYIKENDAFDLILGCKNGKWWIIDVVSIGSVVGLRAGESHHDPALFHLTMNPEIFCEKHEQSLH